MAVDKRAFRAFVQQSLCPTLRTGQVVTVDNFAAHHDPVVRTVIKAHDCLLIHLPAYSPDFAPIEPAFSKIKGQLRQLAARTQEALDQGISTAQESITPEDARGLFKYVGYPLSVRK